MARGKNKSETSENWFSDLQDMVLSDEDDTPKKRGKKGGRSRNNRKSKNRGRSNQ